MRASKIFAAVLLGLLTIALLLGFFLPTSWEVKRALSVPASVRNIHAIVSDLRRFPQWGGWNTDIDPSVAITTLSPYQGVGAKHLWVGDRAGRGSITITQSDEHKGVAFDIAINADRPSIPNAKSTITYEPTEDAVRVVWSAEGDFGNPPFGGFAVLIARDTIGHHMQVALESLAKLCTENRNEPATEPHTDL